MFGKKKSHEDDDLDLSLDSLEENIEEQDEEKGISPMTVACVVTLCLIIVAAGVLWKEVSSFNNSSSTTQTASTDAEATTTPTATPTVTVTEEATTDSDTSWELRLVNKDNPIPSDYEIPELTELKNGQKVDSRIYPSLQEMFDAAKEDGVEPYITSSYRTYQEQQEQMDEKVQEFVNEGMSQDEAETEAKNWVSEPGTSEHELGLAIDISSEDKESQDPTVVWEWLASNSYKYGFILRYPEDKTDITGIDSEPWHFRYVGVDAATEMYEKGITLEEYLDPSLITSSDSSSDEDTDTTDDSSSDSDSDSSDDSSYDSDSDSSYDSSDSDSDFDEEFFNESSYAE